MPITTKQLLTQGRVGPTERSRSGYRFAEATPATVASALQSFERGEPRDWADLCAYMVESDAHVSAVYSTRKYNASRTPIAFEPGFSRQARLQAVAEPAVQFVEETFKQIESFDRSVNDLLDAIGMGYSAAEIEWHKDGREWLPRRLLWRHPRRLRFDKEWNPRLMQENKRVDPEGERLWPNKWVFHVHKEHSNYVTRQGIHRAALWIWVMKTWARKFHINGLEKYAQPFVWLQVPPNTPPATRDKMLSDLESISYDGVGIVEGDGKVNVEAFAQAMGNGEMYEKYLTRANNDITENYLGFTDATDPGTNGARSAVEQRSDDNLDPRTDTSLDQLAATLRRDLVRPILEFNAHLFGGIVPPLPEVRFGALDVEDTPELPVGTLSIAVSAGVVRKNELRGALGFDRIEELGDEFIEVAPPGGAGQSPFDRTPELSPTQPTTSSPMSSRSRSPLAAALCGELEDQGSRSNGRYSRRSKG